MSDEIRLAPFANLALRLLAGTLFYEDSAEWSEFLTYKRDIELYFSQIGLVLVADEERGYAYLRQFTEEEMAGADKLTRLTKRHPLSFRVTMLGILLRERLAAHEKQHNFNEPLLVSFEEMSLMMSKYLGTTNAMTHNKRLKSVIEELMKLGYLVESPNYRNHYRVRTILLTRFREEELTDFKARLEEFAGQIDFIEEEEDDEQ